MLQSRPLLYSVLGFLAVSFSIILTVSARNAKGDVIPDPVKNQGFRPGVVIVKLRPEAANPLRAAVAQKIAFPALPIPAALRTKLTENRATGVDPLIPSSKAAATEVDQIFTISIAKETDIPAAVVSLSGDPDVLFAQPDFIAEAFVTPNDPFYVDGSQWALDMINASQAWDNSTGTDVIVAVIDTGVDITHPDLAAHIWVNNDPPGDNPPGISCAGFNNADDDCNGFIDDTNGWNFARFDANGNPIQGGNNAIQDLMGHGTHVAGIIGAVGNNGIGIAGLAYNCRIMVVRGLGANGIGYTSTLAPCIKYAVDNGASVINNSWGGLGRNPTIDSMVDYARDNNVLVVSAAGNSNLETCLFNPSNSENSMSVSALTNVPVSKATYSNFGVKVDVGAPGGSGGGTSQTDVLSTVLSGGYEPHAGTSMAAPYVSALAALIRKMQPTWTSEQVKHVIQQSANPNIIPPDFDLYSGYGLIDAQAALNRALPLQGNTPPPVASITTPYNCQTVSGTIEIVGSATASSFEFYEVWYGEGNLPETWTLVSPQGTAPQPFGVLASWDTSSFSGVYTLRLVTKDTQLLIVSEDRNVIDIDNSSSATPCSHFSSGFGTQDWTAIDRENINGPGNDCAIVDTPNPHTVLPQPIEGNPGGYISASDDFSNVDFYFRAPAAFVGDQSAHFGEDLWFDVKTGGADYCDPSYFLFSPNILILEPNTGPPIAHHGPSCFPLNTWMRVRIPLDESAGWHHICDSSPLAPGELFSVLKDLKWLDIKGEYASGFDTGGLDNVCFRAHDSTMDCMHVVNGAFEEPWPNFNFGWTPSGVDPSGGLLPPSINQSAAYWLFGALNSDPILTQTITSLSVGRSYELSGDYASRLYNDNPPGSINTRSFSVSIGDLPPWTYVPTPLLQWQHFSETFTATSSSMVLQLAAELNSTNNDFMVDNIKICLCNPSISGTKFIDNDCDGVHDSNEPGLAGWTITAINEATGAQYHAVTSSSPLGQYSINGLPTGSYSVLETAQSNYVQTLPRCNARTVALGCAPQTNIDFGNCPCQANASSVSLGGGCTECLVGGPSGPLLNSWQVVSAPAQGNPLTPFATTNVPNAVAQAAGWCTNCGGGWISASQNPNDVTLTSGLYTYRYSFCLDSRFSNPSMSLCVMADSSEFGASVFLNGHFLFDVDPAFGPCTNHVYAAAFLQPLLRPGENQIDVVVDHDSGPGGINVQGAFNDPTGRCCPSPLCPCVTPPSGMIGWWPLDEAIGATVYDDISGTPQNAINSGDPGPSVVSGVVGLARNYGGNPPPSIVPNPDADALNAGTGDFSIDAWVKTNPVGQVSHSIVEKLYVRAPNPPSDPGDMIGYTLGIDGQGRLNGSLVTSIFFNGNAGAQAGQIDDARWHHVAMTVIRNSPTGGKVYVDGVPTTFDPTNAAGDISNGETFKIGGRSSSAAFQGAIDEVEFFNRALTPAEVYAIYAAGSSGKCKCPCMGDMNGDGKLNGGDIHPFMVCIADPPPGCACGDMNGDGMVTAADISGFVDAMLIGCP
ncbi:MAG TPA: S8 family serine peptidase [Phycisphaerae bacterium]|nr:S8 family serine peptidase [Phycisphaerae bacterium]